MLCVAPPSLSPLRNLYNSSAFFFLHLRLCFFDCIGDFGGEEEGERTLGMA